MSWTLNDTVATYSNKHATLTLDTARPGLGVHPILPGGPDFSDFRFFCLQGTPETESESIRECVIRDDDLIVDYQQHPDRTAFPRLVWQVNAQGGEGVQVDLTIAMQTGLLDSDPSVTVRSAGLQAPVWVLPPAAISADDFVEWKSGMASQGLLLCKIRESWSYAEMVYPADFQSAELESHQDGMVYPLMREFLEKGVIRKARVRGTLIPQEGDLARAWNEFNALKVAAPPLST